MNDIQAAKELTAAAREITALTVRKRATVILRPEDFKHSTEWNMVLDALDIPYGEAASFKEPSEVELQVVGAKVH